MNQAQAQTRAKKRSFMSKLLHRSKQHSERPSVLPPAIDSAVNTNLNNHNDVCDSFDIKDSALENEENAHLEEALLQSYEEHLSFQPTPAPRVRSEPFMESMKNLFFSVVAPFYAVYEALAVFAIVISAIGYGLVYLSKAARPSPNQSRQSSIRDHPLIAILIFPVTLIILMLEGLKKCAPRPYTPAPRPVARPPHPSRDCLVKFFQFISQPRQPVVATPAFRGRPRAGRPCRCKECSIM